MQTVSELQVQLDRTDKPRKVRDAFPWESTIDSATGIRSCHEPREHAHQYVTMIAQWGSFAGTTQPREMYSSRPIRLDISMVGLPQAIGRTLQLIPRLFETVYRTAKLPKLGK
jgi:hypothetical protein